MSQRDAALEVIDQHDGELNRYANQYTTKLAETTDQTDECEIKNLVRRIVSNIKITDEDARIIRQELNAIIEGRSPGEIEPRESEKSKITDREIADIADGLVVFIKQTTQKEEIVTLRDFERYAEKTGYPLEKVLYSNPWTGAEMTEKASQRVREADEVVELVSRPHSASAVN
ncbi:hypothetical protein GCM10009647_084920 [Streptomyces sanglieri]